LYGLDTEKLWCPCFVWVLKVSNSTAYQSICRNRGICKRKQALFEGGTCEKTFDLVRARCCFGVTIVVMETLIWFLYIMLSYEYMCRFYNKINICNFCRGQATVLSFNIALGPCNIYTIWMYLGLRVEWPIFLSDFNQIWIPFTDYNKSLQYQISLKFVREELRSICGRTDRHEKAKKTILAVIWTRLQLF